MTLTRDEIKAVINDLMSRGTVFLPHTADKLFLEAPGSFWTEDEALDWLTDATISEEKRALEVMFNASRS